MTDPDQALATQLKNIEARSGQPVAHWLALIGSASLTKHGELVAWLKAEFGFGHGDANTLVHLAKRSVEPKSAAATDDPLDAIYAGNKAALRPMHEAVVKAMSALGPFETAPKQANVSYRRKKQFALIGPATKTQIEVGLNGKGLSGSARLEALAPGKMCAYRVRLSTLDEVDAELIGWLGAAYQQAG